MEKTIVYDDEKMIDKFYDTFIKGKETLIKNSKVCK